MRFAFPSSLATKPFLMFVVCLFFGLFSAQAEGAPGGARILLDQAVIFVSSGETSYVQYGAVDLGNYLKEISGHPINVVNSRDGVKKANTVIVVGERAAAALQLDMADAKNLGPEGALLRAIEKDGRKFVLVAGNDPKGTNSGLASFSALIQADGSIPYVTAPLDVKSAPHTAVRGFHLNGWSLKYPYGFRTWKEEDWKRFVDIAWAEHVNLFYLWPFMEIIPVPLSQQDEAYLQEVRRVVDYAQKQRGMVVWIMQSANRVAVSNCGSVDPRFRTYWVGDCQKDMNPAEAQEFSKIERSFESLYRIVDNADGFCLIDSDPGGWPHSPLSDQSKIFNSARTLLNRYNIHKEQAKLIDWMWIGWGQVFEPSAFGLSREEREKKAVLFMVDTIRNFKKNLKEPWELIAGMSSYLKSAQIESVLDKTIYLHYGAIELEPAFPATNMGLEPVREVLDKADEYPQLRGLMGNNEIMLLQFPRTFYFFNSLWDKNYRSSDENKVILDVSGKLYPDHAQLIADSFFALSEKDSAKIRETLSKLDNFVRGNDGGRAGAIGRYLFPDRLSVAKALQRQLEIRLARQSLINAMESNPSVEEASRLVENYFDRLLAWNEETGWDTMLNITIWRTPIYEEGKDLSEAMGQLKKVLAQGKPYTSYERIGGFFDAIEKNLEKKYGRDSVMVGCVEPFKLAVIQSWQ